MLWLDLNADALILYLFDPTTKQPTFHSAVGLHKPQGLKEQSHSWKGLVWRVVLKRDIVTLVNIWAETSSLVRSELFLQEDFISYSGIAITNNGLALGVLEAFFRREYQPDLIWYGQLRRAAKALSVLVKNT